MQNKLINNPVILIVLDGLGYSTHYHGNALKQAYTPTLDHLWHHYPKTLLHASGNYVGLPEGQVGNSEVGHTTIGAGRKINQELVRIGEAITTGSFFKNTTLTNIYNLTKINKKKIHLIGLCSDGGVHSHISHLIALIKLGKNINYNNIQICIHIITDGRDTEPQNTKLFINLILNVIQDAPNIKICTISGRYYSMDRDCRWQRTAKAYECLVTNTIKSRYFNRAYKVIDDYYKNEIYDEFIIPTRINSGKIEDGDGVIFFNFRPDRIRQLVQSICDPLFQGFITQKFNHLNITTFTNYDNNLNLPIVFPTIAKNNFLGQIISEKGFKQFRLAETEKYAHVTYFFNGGREEPFPGEDRELIPSPKVDTYDSTPNMSANNITEKLVQAIQKNIYKLVVVNYANPDMVGHTGNLQATKNSIESIDSCLSILLNTIKTINTTIIITADHGNAEKMLNNYNQPCKSHTNNLVPFIIIDKQSSQNNNKKNLNILKKEGSLADIAPTILHILNIKKPKDMDGHSLIAKYNNKQLITYSQNFPN